MSLRPLLFALACVCAPVAAQAECLTDAQAVALFDAFTARTPAANPEGLNEADGACTRAKFNNLLAVRYGTVIGYKAGLTNPAVQKRFNYDRPVWGVLYADMLLPSGSVVEAGFGARPLFEADLLVRVKSEAINQAKTPAEVLAAIDQVIPFIELPDLMVQAPPRLNGPAISAINVGARFGVTGTPIAIPPYRAERFALLDALRDMTVVLSDASGAELARGKGSDILGHPLSAVVWLAEALAKDGKAMKPGDLISLGSFSPLLPPKAGSGATVTYLGLPNAKPVSVSFK
ncbi:2-keto-4-pentenoate hydratase [Piscinibacter sp. HJYY11]|uniref:2-keto-4-pentenoate hydratase n=1 Tax=Piscinibacter sp. HJYY11 TaxID=2801333 RepID=UPI00191D5AF5|nr:fumarylacetoacetate hydrolase [Piscinibacter sp. HJYY11]MBL0728688.1 fumarylacetoacetate hydrolase [Piscinibacter sp. HJYY11]